MKRKSVIMSVMFLKQGRKAVLLKALARSKIKLVNLKRHDLCRSLSEATVTAVKCKLGPVLN
jgi:hypothetical protein